MEYAQLFIFSEVIVRQQRTQSKLLQLRTQISLHFKLVYIRLYKYTSQAISPNIQKVFSKLTSQAHYSVYL